MGEYGELKKIAKTLVKKDIKKILIFFDLFANEMQEKYNDLSSDNYYIDVYGKMAEIMLKREDYAPHEFVYAVASKVAEIEKWKLF